MINNNIKKTISQAINFEKQSNLNRVTIIFNSIFQSGFQLNYYYDFGSISEKNQESISRIETIIYSSLSSKQVNDFEIRSAIFQNTFQPVNGEEEVYFRD